MHRTCRKRVVNAEHHERPASPTFQLGSANESKLAIRGGALHHQLCRPRTRRAGPTAAGEGAGTAIPQGVQWYDRQNVWIGF